MAAERHRDALAESEPDVEQEAPEGAPVECGAEQAPPKPQCDHADAEQQLAKDLEELAAKAEKADEYLLLAQRTQADFENYRKRAAREAALAQERGIAKLAKELLPAIDNLDRALKAASEEQSPLTEGIKLVHTDLLSALQRVGVEPFSPEGDPFDPQLHEAVAQQPIEGAESGTVAEVFQPGYRLGDTVLRPARVLVAG
jgi:molecular chaperone GrpE